MLGQGALRHGRLRLCGPVLRGLLASVGFLVAGSLSAPSEVPPKPVARLPLGSLGFPGYAVSLLHAGASMATVHVLDGSHVLFTYSLRSLVPRLPGDSADDSTRQVAAELIEVPSGKVLARTVWHLHDHGRYLWSVGRGVFVLRTGSALSAFAPLATMAAGKDPFLRYTMSHHAGSPVLVQSAPDGKVVMVELALEEAAETTANGDVPLHRHKHYVLDFFRLVPGRDGAPALTVEPAGAVGAPNLVKLALDGDGYLWAEDGERGRYMLSFNEFGGRQEKLAPVMSSCHPRLNLLSRSQFLVETCRGTDDAAMLASFGFDGHENWQEAFGESLQPPTLALAPEAGRFALSRIMASSGGAPVNGMAEADPLSQEIRVYQTESGDMLLRLQCTPAVRSSENFDLSPDGRTLVVLGTETMDVYRLAELSAKDRKDLAEAQTMTPPEGTGPVVLTRITRPVAATETVAGGEAVHTPAIPTKAEAPPRHVGSGPAETEPATSPKVAEGAQGAVAAVNPAGPADGDAQPAAAPRKPPTLLNPGEHPEFKGPPAGPQ